MTLATDTRSFVVLRDNMAPCRYLFVAPLQLHLRKNSDKLYIHFLLQKIYTKQRIHL